MLPAEIPNVDPERQKPEGMYVCYIDSDFQTKFADKELLLWSNGNWYRRPGSIKYRGHVYSCYGPLPGLKIEDLIE